MTIQLLKCKIHRATVTNANLDYEGSISIDKNLIDLAGLHLFEKVDIYNCNNGERFSTYVIEGGSGEICLNGPAARLVHKNDRILICAFANFEPQEAPSHKPKLVFLDEKNAPKIL